MINFSNQEMQLSGQITYDNAESYYQQAEHYLRLNNEYKENIVILPRAEAKASEKDEALIAANDFELSIEQELAIAQASL